MGKKRSAVARFGKGWALALADGRTLDVGQTIAGEGPGKGFAMTPWCLSKYERALQLRPGESWLLQRLLKHAWTQDGEVYISLRKVERESCVTRKTVLTYLRHLEALGYVKVLGRVGGQDRRLKLDVSGTYAALALCIAADPRSAWAQDNDGPVAASNHGTGFDLDLEALQ